MRLAEVVINQFGVRFAIFLGLVLFPCASVIACSRSGPFKLSELFIADIIVRATAVRYVVAPDPVLRTRGVPESTVEFKTEENIRGVDIPSSFALNGYLTNRDDFNDGPLPYRFVRRGGRGGSCFANNYREGAQFLLFIKRRDSNYTIDFSPLGPTNEQLTGADDPWVSWVKAYLAPCVSSDNNGQDYGNRPQSEFESLLAQTRSDLDKYRLAKCYLARFGSRSVEAPSYMKIVESYETVPQRR